MGFKMNTSIYLDIIYVAASRSRTFPRLLDGHLLRSFGCKTSPWNNPCQRLNWRLCEVTDAGSAQVQESDPERLVFENRHFQRLETRGFSKLYLVVRLLSRPWCRIMHCAGGLNLDFEDCGEQPRSTACCHILK